MPTPETRPVPETGRLKQKVLFVSMPAVIVVEVVVPVVVYVVMS